MSILQLNTKHRAAGHAGVSLLHFDGTNGSTTFTDFYGNTWSAVGGAALTTTGPKFGTACLGTSGSSAAKSVNAAWNQWSGDLTLEGWFKTSVGSGSFQRGFNIRDPSTGATTFALSVDSTAGDLRWSAQTGAGVAIFDRTTSTSISNGAYHHLAFVLHGTVWTLYADGTSIDTVTNSTRPGTGGDIYVGGQATAGINPWQGTIDEVRFSNVAQYTANFTPPSAAFTQ